MPSQSFTKLLWQSKLVTKKNSIQFVRETFHSCFQVFFNRATFLDVLDFEFAFAAFGGVFFQTGGHFRFVGKVEVRTPGRRCFNRDFRYSVLYCVFVFNRCYHFFFKHSECFSRSSKLYRRFFFFPRPFTGRRNARAHAEYKPYSKSSAQESFCHSGLG
jgi:hypothetical protein